VLPPVATQLLLKLRSNSHSKSRIRSKTTLIKRRSSLSLLIKWQLVIKSELILVLTLWLQSTI